MNQELEMVDPSLPEMPDDNEIKQLTNREYRQLVHSVGRLTAIVSALSTKTLELTRANNKIVEAVNGLPKNEMLIQAVAAEVIAISDSAEQKVTDQIAQTIAAYHLTDSDSMIESMEALEGRYFRAQYKVVRTKEDGTDECELNVESRDDTTGEFSAMSFINDDDKLLGKAIQFYLINYKNAQPDQTYYIRYVDKALETPNGVNQEFNEFMDNAMNKQGAVGDFNTSVEVSREAVENGVRFKFTEAGEVDETPFSFEAYEIEDGVEKAVSLDADLGMYYTSCVQAAGGKSNEFWYITHR